jgi:predicted lipid-binding transport protein (Tim44 family)
MGPLAGLAAGLGLAALASHFGFGGELASVLMFALLAIAVVMVIGFFMRRRASGGTPASNDGSLRYAAATTDQPPMARNAGEMLLPGGSAAPSASTSALVPEHTNAVGTIPADFDTAAFVRNAKVNFIRLQAANDAGNLDDIRAFTTPEMFAEIKMNIGERGAAAQETDVVAIEAEVLDVTQEDTRYVVSVRFTGQIREEKNAAAEPVDEIWHMVKPLDGKSGWVVAGIQQVQ